MLLTKYFELTSPFRVEKTSFQKGFFFCCIFMNLYLDLGFNISWENLSEGEQQFIL